MEAIKQVTQTEQNAQDRRAEATAAAKKLVADAEREGKAHLQQMRAQAEEQVRGLLSEAESRAAQHTEEVLAEQAKACDALRNKAAGRLDEAAALIVRRVVNS